MMGGPPTIDEVRPLISARLLLAEEANTQEMDLQRDRSCKRG